MLKYLKAISTVSFLVLSLQISKPAHAKGTAVLANMAITIASLVGLFSSGIALGVLSNSPYCPNNLELDSQRDPYPCQRDQHLTTCYQTVYFCRDPQTKVVVVDPAPTRYSKGREDAKWATLAFGVSSLVFGTTTVALWCCKK
jgi:hypothetical protein